MIMAQLYKMTLYVCDLEESLSLDEIKILIGERAMNGISVNAICHFANEQIGEQIEWDDDVDLNQWRCPTSAWDKYFTPPIKERTNADRIRAMSDELLASQLVVVIEETIKALTDLDVPDAILNEVRSQLLERLKQPAEDE